MNIAGELKECQSDGPSTSQAQKKDENESFCSHLMCYRNEGTLYSQWGGQLGCLEEQDRICAKFLLQVSQMSFYSATAMKKLCLPFRPLVTPLHTTIT